MEKKYLAFLGDRASSSAQTVETGRIGHVRIFGKRACVLLGISTVFVASL